MEPGPAHDLKDFFETIKSAFVATLNAIGSLFATPSPTQPNINEKPVNNNVPNSKDPAAQAATGGAKPNSSCPTSCTVSSAQIEQAMREQGPIVLILGADDEASAPNGPASGNTALKEALGNDAQKIEKELAARITRETEKIAAKGETLPYPKVVDKKLEDIVNNLYKGTKNPEHIGNGTTMDAIRSEKLTGNPTQGKFHTQSGQDNARALEKWIRDNPGGSLHDKLVAHSLLSELRSVLHGK